MDVHWSYCPASSSNKKEFWLKLRGLKERWPGPWVVGGNFNFIRFVNEKSLGSGITHSMRNFEEFVSFGNLRDSSLCNAKYTWTNSQERLVMSRLDRFLMGGTWEDFLPTFFSGS